MMWPDQSSYEGNFHLGKMEGLGKRYYSNGNIHEGQWMQDQPHGKGKVYNATKDFFKEGTWEFGKMA